MASTDAQKRASVKWTHKNIKSVSLGLRYDQDADIIEFLDSLPNKQKFIKEAIRKCM